MKRKWIVVIFVLCLAAAGAGVLIWQGNSTKKDFEGVQEQLKQDGNAISKERKNSNSRKTEDRELSSGDGEKETENASEQPDEQTGIRKSLLQTEGKTLQDRILTPEGYQRIKCKKGSFGEFLRSYPLKKHGSPVLLYNGEEKGNQSAHAAVFKLPIEKEDLQQCADSIMMAARKETSPHMPLFLNFL